MRLRNRQTDKVYTLSEDLYIEYTQGGRIELRVFIPGGNMSYYYDSLDKLYHEWEDYEPAEPLIKDEKVRKAVRAWAEANEIEFLDIVSDSRLKDCGGNYIEFLCLPFKELPKKPYHITELCGEEKE